MQEHPPIIAFQWPVSSACSNIFQFLLPSAMVFSSICYFCNLFLYRREKLFGFSSLCFHNVQTIASPNLIGRLFVQSLRVEQINFSFPLVAIYFMYNIHTDNIHKIIRFSSFLEKILIRHKKFTELMINCPFIKHFQH